MSTLNAQAAAVVTGSFLSGAMMSLSLMAVPVLLDTTKEAPHLFSQWTRMYHYGHQVLPTMAVGTLIMYGYIATKRRQEEQQRAWAVFALAGALTVLMLPFTWVFMVPTNNELFRLEAATRGGGAAALALRSVAEAKELVVFWKWLHFARSLFPLAGAVLGAVGTLGDVASKSKEE